MKGYQKSNDILAVPVPTAIMAVERKSRDRAAASSAAVSRSSCPAVTERRRGWKGGGNASKRSPDPITGRLRPSYGQVVQLAYSGTEHSGEQVLNRCVVMA